MNLNLFHPLIERWFSHRFGEPTEPQRLGWPEIAAGRTTLITAPTGSGKTLAAFLACIDRLFREAVDGKLQDQTQVLYVSPLKALSNDVRRNLEVPLDEIRTAAANERLQLEPVRALVRTGDTPAAERQAMLRKPPHILVTTPESLYLLLTGAKSREILRTVRTVIVDEIHALARDKRGSHLTLSLERLDALCHHKPVRIGLSATVQPVDQIAQFLTGRTDQINGAPNPTAGHTPCSVIDIGHVRELDIGVELPPSELSAVCSNEQWAEVYARLVELIQSHRSTLIFVNTRRLSERVAHNLRQHLGDDSVAAHHGSMSREIRLAAEERLKAGSLKAIVATASLELGIDVGFIDLVCQIGSPRSIATFLQRVGRSGHSLGRIPKGRLFPLTRDELIECLALVRAVRARRLDAVEIPVGPLDILAQQIIAAVSCEEWDEDALYELCRGAWPYRDLTRADFDAIVEMASEGIGGDRRRGAYVHRDQVNRRLRARRGARIVAATSGGAIPEVGDYRVVTESDRTFVGSVNEDFAIESIAGDVFILGNTSWRIRYVRGGEVVVSDAQGAPATIPFWLGEAPARTIELSGEISRLREELAERLEAHAARQDAAPPAASRDGLGPEPGPDCDAADPSRDVACQAAVDAATDWLQHDCAVDRHAARQAVHYVAAQQAAIGLVPSRRRIVFERFFDESGGMQLVIHAPLGGRINRAWGLAMRKRFCRSFDFELQAAADDNGIVLALGPQHSFPISDMFKMLRPDNAEHMLVQALLAVPMFPTRWRWNATRALAVLRQRNGKKVPPYLQKFRADDLLTAVFPACTACLENRPEDLPIPDHPLVKQTIYDCLHEAMDIDRFVSVLADIEAGRVELVARDTREPSPFSHQLLNANPYAFLDDAPLEERRTRAVTMRRSFTVESVRDLGRLDQAAIDQVRSEAWPLVRDPDELHDALLLLAALPEPDGHEWIRWFDELVQASRAVRLQRTGRPTLWVAAERIDLVRDAFPDATVQGAAGRPTAVCDRPTEVTDTAGGPPALRDRPTEATDTAGGPPALRGRPTEVTDTAGGPPALRGSEARIALVRGRLDCLGPLTATRIAEQLGLERDAVFAALEALEGEGFAMRGQFTPTGPSGNGNGSTDREVEWCARRLLARIHRLTLDGLRRQIQPVDTAQFIRFLLEHQRVAGVNPLRGRRALVDVLEQLQGFEAPAGAWEYDILPARVRDYDSRWLDELSLSGHVAWGRFAPPRRSDDAPARGTLTRAVPIALGFRDDMNWLVPGDRSDVSVKLRANAQIVLELLSSRGALFAGDLVAATGLLPSQLDEALRELAAVGRVTADGFAAIRSVAMSGRHGRAGPRRLAGWGKLSLRSEPSGGRWSLFAQPTAELSAEQRAERWAQLLLRRYGIVFRDLLLRESSAPPWRDLVRVYRRSEARGEVRGGRFVAGVAGEQFALPHAVDAVRRVRDEKTEAADAVMILAASDPANVFAAITDGPRIAATRGNRIAVRGGRVLASLEAGTVRFHADVEPRQARELEQSLRMNALARHRHQQASHAW